MTTHYPGDITLTMPRLPAPTDEILEIRYKCYFCKEFSADNSKTNLGFLHCPNCNTDFMVDASNKVVFVVFYLSKPRVENEFYYLWIDFDRKETGLVRRSNPINPETDGVILRTPQIFYVMPKDVPKLVRRLKKIKAFL